MAKLTNPRTGEEQPVEVRITGPVTHDLGPVVVTAEETENSR